LLLPAGMRCVDRVQQDIRRRRLLECRPERCVEMARQLPDAADRVRDQRLHAGREPDGTRGRIERREQTVLDEQLGAGECSEDRRLPGVRVTDECCTELVRAALALRLATARYGRELLAQVADATADQPAVRFQLRFTGSAETDTT